MYVCIFAKLDLHTSNMIENVTKIPETAKDSAYKTGLLWSFIKAEICALNNVSHFILGHIRKVSFFEFGSKFKIFCLSHA